MVERTIGSYRLTAKLGSGATGEVYLAEHLRLRRNVALKLLRPALAVDEQAVERLFEEARTAARLHSPGIVQVYDCDLTPEGQPFLAMEYLGGETLADRLSRGPLAPDYRLIAELGRQIAVALSTAHAAGVIHRDLKPANLLLPSAAGTGVMVKILDFGIAKLAEDAHEGGPSRTRGGELVGTPAYMAPEQCRGRGTVDPRADVYALGCVLYEMVCGRPPFWTEGAGELISAHLNDPVPDPRKRDRTLPPELRSLMLAMLEKDPDRRPQSMEAVRASLTEFLNAGSGVREVPAGLGIQGRRLWVGAAVGALGVVGTVLWLGRRSPEPSPAAAASSSSPSSPQERRPAAVGADAGAVRAPAPTRTDRRPKKAAGSSKTVQPASPTGETTPFRPFGD